MEVSRRAKRQDEGSRTDFKNLRAQSGRQKFNKNIVGKS